MKYITLLLLLSSCSLGKVSNPPLDTVDYVDLKQYTGTWYEIARFDQKFQKGCSAVSATYSLRDDGDINVENSCKRGGLQGEKSVAKARAWVTDKKTNAKLKVQFFLSGIKLPFLAGDYWILELDPKYQHVIVGDESRKYLWILSRSKKMDESLYLELKRKAEDMHFDTSKLIKTLQ